MHEILYAWGWPEYLFVTLLLLGWAVLVYTNKAPSVNTIRDFVNVWNSRGGNIVVLVGLTVFALHTCMRFFYHIMFLAENGKLDAQNAIVQVMVAFLTGSVYGLFAGALIKTMTGQEGGTPVPPATPPNSSTTASQTLTSTSTPAPTPEAPAS